MNLIGGCLDFLENRLSTFSITHGRWHRDNHNGFADSWASRVGANNGHFLTTTGLHCISSTDCTLVVGVGISQNIQGMTWCTVSGNRSALLRDSSMIDWSHNDFWLDDFRFNNHVVFGFCGQFTGLEKIIFTSLYIYNTCKIPSFCFLSCTFRYICTPK